MKVTFGEFQYSTETQRLTKAGRTVRLSEQSLRLLTLLLKKPGDVITRDEIRRSLWPETHVDFDHSLNVALNRLRQSLGGKESHFIETVPKLGYRFIAEIHPVDTTPSAAQYPRWRILTWCTIAAIVTAIVAILIVRRHYDRFVDRPHRDIQAPGARVR
jgi:DNA-binding winged helix-turn-helix (wHTH) protein